VTAYPSLLCCSTTVTSACPNWTCFGWVKWSQLPFQSKPSSSSECSCSGIVATGSQWANSIAVSTCTFWKSTLQNISSSSEHFKIAHDMISATEQPTLVLVSNRIESEQGKRRMGSGGGIRRRIEEENWGRTAIYLRTGELLHNTLIHASLFQPNLAYSLTLQRYGLLGQLSSLGFGLCLLHDGPLGRSRISLPSL
jgi:hypothetical protein